jgi:hypothetical protein
MKRKSCFTCTHFIDDKSENPYFECILNPYSENIYLNRKIRMKLNRGNEHYCGDYKRIILDKER